MQSEYSRHYLKSDGMSSWIDSREANPKRQKAATSNIETGGASSLPFWNRETFFGDEVEDVVKDSQDEGSMFRDGGLQNSSNGIDPAVVGFVLRDSTQGCHGDGDGYAWNPASEDFSEQEAERVKIDSSYPKKRLLSSINWKGKQSQSVLTKNSEESFPESVRKGTRNLAVAQQLTREAAESDAHALEIVRNTELSSKPRGIPLAIRLQELVQQASSTGTSTVLRHAQLKGKKGDRRRQTHGKSFASSTKNDLSAIEDDIVEDFDGSGDLQGKKRDGRRQTHWKKSASSRKNDLSAIEDDIVEDFNSSGDLQKESLKGASAVPVISASLLWERCREAVELAPPTDTNPTSADQLSSKQALSGFSERLQNALNKLKSQQTEFQQSLISSRSLHGLSQCVVVLILEKHLEAQLTTCRCKVLQSPPEWNDCGHTSVLALESVDDLPIVEVIFSSKMSGDLELEIGGVVRVHPPWQEIHGAGKFGKIILGTFFCETVE